MDAALAGEVAKTMASLEDHRLWSGAIAAVYQVVWWPPGKTWTARKDQESWKITGPDQAVTQQPAARLEMALWNFQKLEGEKIKPPKDAPKGPPVFVLDLLPGSSRQTPPAPGGGGSPGERPDSSPHRGGEGCRHGTHTPGAISPVAGRNAAADGSCRTSRDGRGEGGGRQGEQELNRGSSGCDLTEAAALKNSRWRRLSGLCGRRAGRPPR